MMTLQHHRLDTSIILSGSMCDQVQTQNRKIPGIVTENHRNTALNCSSYGDSNYGVQSYAVCGRRLSVESICSLRSLTSSFKNERMNLTQSIPYHVVKSIRCSLRRLTTIILRCISLTSSIRYEPYLLAEDILNLDHTHIPTNFSFSASPPLLLSHYPRWAGFVIHVVLSSHVLLNAANPRNW